MKVLFYVGYPLCWAKGGYTIIILETKKSLEKLGVEVLWLHHENLESESPRADIVHYWTRPPSDQHWELARKSGYKVAITDLMQVAVLHPHWTWRLRGFAKPVIRRIMGSGLYSILGTGIYKAADAVMAFTPYEAEYMVTVFDANPASTHFIPNGVESVFLQKDIKPIPDQGLLCLGYICERKNSVEVAHAAKQAGVPVTFIGGPLLGEGDPYFQEFRKLVDGGVVKWLGEIRDRERLAGLLRGCAGFLLASKNEGSPLSVMEAMACERAVMVSDLPNMRSYYGDAVTYCQQPNCPEFVGQLTRFHDQCKVGLTSHFPLISWDQVGERVFDVYRKILFIAP